MRHQKKPNENPKRKRSQSVPSSSSSSSPNSSLNNSNGSGGSDSSSNVPLATLAQRYRRLNQSAETISRTTTTQPQWQLQQLSLPKIVLERMKNIEKETTTTQTEQLITPDNVADYLSSGGDGSDDDEDETPPATPQAQHHHHQTTSATNAAQPAHSVAGPSGIQQPRRRPQQQPKPNNVYSDDSDGSDEYNPFNYE